MDYRTVEAILRDTKECFTDAASPSCAISTMIDSSLQQYESLVRTFNSESWDSLECWHHRIETHVNSLDEDSKLIGYRISEA